VDDGGCRRRFDPADARMGSVHRPPMSTLDPLLPFATDRFAASESKDHPGGGGVFDPWRCRRCAAHSTMHVGERGTNELHHRGRNLWSGVFKVSGMVAVSNDDPTTVLSGQMGNKRSCDLRLDVRIPLSLY
jgi:hypothetical protein